MLAQRFNYLLTLFKKQVFATVDFKCQIEILSHPKKDSNLLTVTV